MSALWTQLLSIAGSIITTLIAAWAKSYFERRRPAIKGAAVKGEPVIED